MPMPLYPPAFARRRQAFTLIELLVVITIIGILIAVLFPAIGGALQSGKRKTAENNMRQLGTGTSIYANNNNDLLPKTHGGSAKPAWGGLTGSLDSLWVNAAPAALDATTAKDYANMPKKNLFYGSGSLFVASGARYPGTKLATPEWAFGMNRKLQEQNGGQIKMGSFSQASSMVLFAEGGMVGEIKPKGYDSQAFNGEMSVGPENFVTRYSQIGCISFLDGHVSGHTAKDVLAPDSGIRWAP